MDDQLYTLLSEIRKYKDKSSRSQEENYFTSIFVWYLNNIDFMSRIFFNFINCPTFVNSTIYTQFKLENQISDSNQSDYKFTTKNYGLIDMFSRNNREFLIIENKINATAYADQIEKYISFVQSLNKNGDLNYSTVYIILITREKTNFGNKLSFANLLSSDSFFKSITWQEIYDEYIKKLSAEQLESTFWKLFESYMCSEGLFKRILLNNKVLRNKLLLKGQCKSIMSDIISNQDIINIFHNLQRNLTTSKFDISQSIEYRWGRIGINLRTIDKNPSRLWWPNIFIGFILDNTDHQLSNYNMPKVVVIVDWNNNRKSISNRNYIIDNYSEKISNFKFNNTNSNVIIETYSELKNKWRFLTIEKDINYFFENSIHKQDEALISFYIYWLNKLICELNIFEIFN